MNNYFDLGGTIRAQRANDTLDLLETLKNKIGITRVADITGLDNIGIPVAISIRPNSKHLATAQGKGLTFLHAKISAIMESIEAYHIENPGLPAMTGSFNEFQDDFPVITPSVFNTSAFVHQAIHDYIFDWAKVTELLTQKTKYIPHILSNLDSTNIRPEYSFFSVSSNGLACGNTLDEATCHAIYEIIERDALYQWGQVSDAKRQQRLIDLNTIDDNLNQCVLQKLQQAHQDVKVWEVTSSISVPVFHCCIYDRHLLRDLGVFRGTGCHLSKEVALFRAVTEAAQSRLTLISGSRDDVFPEFYQNTYDFQPEIFTGTRTYQECINPGITGGFQQDLSTLLDKLQENNYSNILRLNHTKPDIGIPTVHIFIPGMEFKGARI